MSSSAAVTSATSRMSLSASASADSPGSAEPECRLEALDALVDHPIPPLDHAVGVGEERRAGSQRNLRLDDCFGRCEAERWCLSEIEPHDHTGIVVA